jgi:hypothetical protein
LYGIATSKTAIQPRRLLFTLQHHHCTLRRTIRQA